MGSKDTHLIVSEQQETNTRHNGGGIEKCFSFESSYAHDEIKVAPQSSPRP